MLVKGKRSRGNHRTLPLPCPVIYPDYGISLSSKIFLAFLGLTLEHMCEFSVPADMLRHHDPQHGHPQRRTG